LQWLVQRGPHQRLRPLLLHLHLLQHPRLRPLSLHLRLRLLLLHPRLLLLHLAKPTNCFHQLFDDWLPSIKLISTH
jgi:hypothetical protein